MPVTKYMGGGITATSSVLLKIAFTSPDRCFRYVVKSPMNCSCSVQTVHGAVLEGQILS
jgi:hypothetical protein